MLSRYLRQTVAVALVLTIGLVTLPVSAADFSAGRSVIGSVNAVGAVQLRGIGISQEGTLFAGDTIASGPKAYAKVVLGTGSKIELSEKTGVTVDRDSEGVKIAMNAGTLGFTTPTALRFEISSFELTASDGTAGNIAISSTAAGVRAINGKVKVRNLKTSESFVVTKGNEMLLSLKEGIPAASLAEMASNAPVPLPSGEPAPSPTPAPAPVPPPQTPAGRSSGGGIGMDTGAWLVVIGAAAVTGVAVWGVVQAVIDRDDIKNLQTRVNTLEGIVASRTRP
jgi:hypothetical protein